MMTINELAQLSGVSVRTLHYYDEINLLVPSSTTKSGYRLYDENNAARLQQIMFFKELDFPLKQIEQILKSDSYDKAKALRQQKSLLELKAKRLKKLIELADKTLKGENAMSFKEFSMQDIEKAKNEYAAEVKQRWGETDAYKQCSEKTKGYTKQSWQNATQAMGSVFAEFSQIKDTELPSSEKAKNLVKALQRCITDNFYDCTDDILKGLGVMYTADERFTKSIDVCGEGTAAFVSRAIESYFE